MSKIGLEYFEIPLSEDVIQQFASSTGAPAAFIRAYHLELVYTADDGKEYLIGGDGSNSEGKPIKTAAGTPLARHAQGLGESPDTVITAAMRHHQDISDNFENIDLAWQTMIAQAQAIEEAQIPYVFFPGTNSNSIVASTLNSVGVKLLDVVQPELKSMPMYISGAENTLPQVVLVNDGNTGGVPEIESPSDHGALIADLLSPYGFVAAQAVEWIEQNLDKPVEIYVTAKTVGLSNPLLADMLQASYAGITAEDIDDFFTANGIVTARALLQQYGLTLDQASAWIADNRTDSTLIQQTAADVGLDDFMLSEIVGILQPGITPAELPGFLGYA